MNKFLFLGNEKLATGIENKYTLLKSLLEADYIPERIVLRGGDNTKIDPTLQQIADAKKLPIICISSVDELNEVISTTKPQFAVLASFGMIIPQNTLDLFPQGVINVHPSLLPKYRGSTPIESALYDLPDETGVTIIKLVNEMDAGPILSQASVVLNSTTTKQQLYEELATIGAAHLISILNNLDSSILSTTKQIESEATYTTQLNPIDAELDFTHSAQQLEQKIKAHLGWPGSTTTLFGKKVSILNAQASNADSINSEAPGTVVHTKKLLQVTCGNNTMLTINQLRPQGKKTMDAVSFINGYAKN